MKYFYMEPEVPGGLGPKTIIEGDPASPIIRHFHLVFDDWLGDALVESTPCFACTDMLCDIFIKERLSGLCFRDMSVDVSELFADLSPGQSLPRFHNALVTGKHLCDDFFLSDDKRLVVSERAAKILEPLCPHAIFEPFNTK